jgi:hypothetical protein
MRTIVSRNREVGNGRSLFRLNSLTNKFVVNSPRTLLFDFYFGDQAAAVQLNFYCVTQVHLIAGA